VLLRDGRIPILRAEKVCYCARSISLIRVNTYCSPLRILSSPWLRPTMACSFRKHFLAALNPSLRPVSVDFFASPFDMAGQSEVRDLPNVSGDFGRFRSRTTCNKSLRRVEAITNTVVPHLVLLDYMLSAAACYGSQRYFIFQSLFYQLKSPCNTSLCTVECSNAFSSRPCRTTCNNQRRRNDTQEITQTWPQMKRLHEDYTSR